MQIRPGERVRAGANRSQVHPQLERGGFCRKRCCSFHFPLWGLPPSVHSADSAHSAAASWRWGCYIFIIEGNFLHLNRYAFVVNDSWRQVRSPRYLLEAGDAWRRRGSSWDGWPFCVWQRCDSTLSDSPAIHHPRSARCHSVALLNMYQIDGIRFALMKSASNSPDKCNTKEAARAAISRSVGKARTPFLPWPQKRRC